jgi:hypothetical protein
VNVNQRCRLTGSLFVTLVLFLPIVSYGDPHGQPLTENAALDLLVRTLKRDHVYTNRISLDCISYQTEQTTDAYFQFTLREIHDAKCGGDPETNPTLNRYRVYRASRKIKWLEETEDRWHAYNPGENQVALQICAILTWRTCASFELPQWKCRFFSESMSILLC